jgi:hypothetical protein
MITLNGSNAMEDSLLNTVIEIIQAIKGKLLSN